MGINYLRISAVLTKELKSEFRTRYAISAVLLFVLTTITMIMFATAGETITPMIAAGILWVIMFFASMTGLSKVFVSEEERGTYILLQLSSTPYAIYFGKLLFNVLLSASLNFFAVVLFFLFLGDIEVKNLTLFISTIAIGSLSVASATTIISALIAKANSKNALFPVLSFPILLPIIILGVGLTKMSFEGIAFEDAMKDLQMMVAYSGLMIVASYFLFDFVNKD
ncbi:MAG: heme exporter protein CcmB [Desulfobulbaceae bacterium]|nr:heme exporter protein CcmB [Candidatus Kapabacteria bacterium]MBS3999395.1 heme exporter protein CcmB [Desulfobulbaceae bacterium]